MTRLSEHLSLGAWAGASLTNRVSQHPRAVPVGVLAGSVLIGGGNVLSAMTRTGALKRR